jgi:hypothetical protein
MASPKQYHPTVKGIFEWANSELEHVGRIASVEDPDLQYSYAMSTVNGMAYLKDAIYELVTDPKYSMHKEDLLRLHGAVIRTMKHLVKDYKTDLNAIKTFNTRKVLSNRNFSYLKNAKNTKNNATNNKKNNTEKNNTENNKNNAENNTNNKKKNAETNEKKRKTRKNRKY